MADDSSASTAQIDLYWRPGCGFCSMLQGKLDQLGIDRVEHNIWDEPSDAAIVRGHANGNETVPTVVIAGTAFVNPSAGELVAFLGTNHPELLPANSAAPEPNVLSRLVGKFFG